MANSLNEEFEAYSIFCDDVRQENNGKFLLVGVYGNEMVMNAGPSLVPLAILLQAKTFPKGDHKVRITVRKHIGEQSTAITGVEGDVQITQAHLGITIPVPIFTVHVDSDCILSVSVEINENEAVNVGQLFINALFAQP